MPFLILHEQQVWERHYVETDVPLKPSAGHLALLLVGNHYLSTIESILDPRSSSVNEVSNSEKIPGITPLTPRGKLEEI